MTERYRFDSVLPKSEILEEVAGQPCRVKHDLRSNMEQNSTQNDRAYWMAT
jgi:hypothetical protein